MADAPLFSGSDHLSDLSAPIECVRVWYYIYTYVVKDRSIIDRCDHQQRPRQYDAYLSGWATHTQLRNGTDHNYEFSYYCRTQDPA